MPASILFDHAIRKMLPSDSLLDHHGIIEVLTKPNKPPIQEMYLGQRYLSNQTEWSRKLRGRAQEVTAACYSNRHVEKQIENKVTPTQRALVMALGRCVHASKFLNALDTSQPGPLSDLMRLSTLVEFCKRRILFDIKPTPHVKWLGEQIAPTRMRLDRALQYPSRPRAADGYHFVATMHNHQDSSELRVFSLFDRVVILSAATPSDAESGVYLMPSAFAAAHYTAAAGYEVTLSAQSVPGATCFFGEHFGVNTDTPLGKCATMIVDQMKEKYYQPISATLNADGRDNRFYDFHQDLHY